MGKSLGNFVTIKDALKKYRPEALRMFILQGLYRSPADYSDESLQAASKGWDRLNAAARRVRNELKQATPDLGKDNTPELNQNLMNELDKTRLQFASVMNDDFNTPLAIGALFDLSTEVNRWIDKGIATKEALEHANQIYTELGGDVLGVIANDEARADSGNAAREAQLIEWLIQLRLDARKAKDFARADEIRKRLGELGVVLEDGPKGTTYRIA
jgi:cysteinyl-tRNA synthetase